ncbi:MAG: PLD nuclease N-terminal domain-containing protein [Coriobacteriia bacterium]|nr:PLD nuclease N-terminal domain-containing protein [Coriobacteriia bacterium]
MMGTQIAWGDIPAGLQIGLIALAVVQIGVEVFALFKLFRTPDEQLVFGKKWPWVIIILFVNLVGAIAFLAAGRKPAAAVDPLSTAAEGAPAAGDRAARAADVLYGSGSDAE